MSRRPVQTALAFSWGAAWFTCCAFLVGVPAMSSMRVAGILLTALDVLVVIAVTRLLGIAHALAVGVAGVVALDWYCLPPVHDHGPPDTRNALALGAYLLTGALLGRVAEGAGVRARESEGEMRVLAAEQAALRRVATLIAAESPADRVFEALTHEVGELLHLDLVVLLRYESDRTVGVRWGWSRVGPQPPSGSRWTLTANALASRVRDAGHPCRIADMAEHDDPFDVWMSQAGARSCIASPVVVPGNLWGVMVGASLSDEPLPDGTERRLGEFTELAATAVAHAHARDELAASRVRIVDSADRARQRIERDLHDGVQQRLVSLALDVRQAEALAESCPVELRDRLSELRVGLAGAIDDLREVAHGIHPSILSEGGLRPALAGLARRSPIPVELRVRGLDRVPDPVEVGLYYVVSEALTNALKHAQATAITVELQLGASVSHLVVRDDGVGGANVRAGSGLVGMVDRLHALGGAIEMSSPPGQGTRLDVRVPWDARSFEHDNEE